MLFRRPQDLAGLVRDGRTSREWSQQELANRVGVSRQWISLVENGKTSVEFDLVMGVLHVLGYRLHVSLGHGTPNTHIYHPGVNTPSHAASGRKPLTRRGDPLGTERTKRRSRSPEATERPA